MKGRVTAIIDRELACIYLVVDPNYSSLYIDIELVSKVAEVGYQLLVQPDSEVLRINID